ncbi:hypothetical protein COY26_05070 [Candidatus Woesearchaeota archaeon CG_4_10_14_0_2_um_filter_33_10]|nr:MAG: hypothetical protein AUJ83_04595 [Candidatus Woesearchaeota archaeon CG1_02_33_12]PIN79131.1 MAG: hypothetical protein COV14_00700 [Candidatus Woesearchaeota archaeon CG10_big_fil_rev_8_21_14_0_10_33_12]PIU72208.1 MAG: hypothetical protein COS79_04150 [Candidatus Woesearchaeota archaeon CG06_land_8_20_14_3_00_33_13]PIZ52175.1 MAG: hypothetical protein COY26_05070 [Candidatus Woesearchaeota archaeon CG_4_10_14_0_2_um_filter_33_10]
MEKKIGRFVYWTPRILSILFLIFLALMSLDVFDMKLGFWGTIIGLFMHNIPVFILTILLIISWKHEIVGGIAFILAGILYIAILLMNAVKTGFKVYYLAWAVQISGIAFFIGIMFLVGWFKKRKSVKKSLL